jgi:hypothetical protein
MRGEMDYLSCPWCPLQLQRQGDDATHQCPPAEEGGAVLAWAGVQASSRWRKAWRVLDHAGNPAGSQELLGAVLTFPGGGDGGGDDDDGGGGSGEGSGVGVGVMLSSWNQPR